MKRIILILFLSLAFGKSKSQITRYYEFKLLSSSVNWQDSSFIAATSDQVVIDSVSADLARPLSQRKFINGRIDHGDAGYNHNASHWFLWHFIPGQWTLTDLSIEVCDGRPYSDVDLDTATWIGNIGRFCPWNSKPAREILNPTALHDIALSRDIVLYPNPATSVLKINWQGDHSMLVNIYNAVGMEMVTGVLSRQNNNIALQDLPGGIYFVKLREGNRTIIKKLVVEAE